MDGFIEHAVVFRSLPCHRQMATPSVRTLIPEAGADIEAKDEDGVRFDFS